jgi:hypothetical protein
LPLTSRLRCICTIGASLTGDHWPRGCWLVVTSGGDSLEGAEELPEGPQAANIGKSRTITAYITWTPLLEDWDEGISKGYRGAWSIVRSPTHIAATCAS